MNTQKEPKFRPYLSGNAIQRILEYQQELSSLHKQDPEKISDSWGDAIDNEIKEALALLLIKLSAGFTKPSYIPNPKATLAERLGISPDEPPIEMFENLKKTLGVIKK